MILALTYLLRSEVTQLLLYVQPVPLVMKSEVMIDRQGEGSDASASSEP